jgi:hypothetical protein
MSTLVEEVGAFLNGRRYVMDGIAGVIRFKSYKAIYPYDRVVHSVWHEAAGEGKDSPRYQETKRELGDDWVTDLTDSDRLFEIAAELGFTMSVEPKADRPPEESTSKN